jgi:hypothetical protein
MVLLWANAGSAYVRAAPQDPAVTRETWHVVLTVTGATCEIVGLTWLVADASRARSKEFGEHGVLRRVWNWFAYWLGPPSQPIVKNIDAAVELSASLGLAVASGQETELERIQRELNDLRERVSRHEEDVGRRFADLEARTSAAAANLQTRINELEARAREERRTSLRTEMRGARLFILGAILSAIANLI